MARHELTTTENLVHCMKCGRTWNVLETSAYPHDCPSPEEPIRFTSAFSVETYYGPRIVGLDQSGQLWMSTKETLVPNGPYIRDNYNLWRKVIMPDPKRQYDVVDSR